MILITSGARSIVQYIRSRGCLQCEFNSCARHVRWLWICWPRGTFERSCHTTFVDLAPECTQTAMRNSVTCGFEGQTSFVCARAEDVLTDPLKFGLTEPYGLISITPPYEEVIYKVLIDAVCNSPLVVADTLVVIEYPVEMGSLPYILGTDKLYGIRNRKYGRTVLGLYVYRPNSKYDMRPLEFLAVT